jgi:hypothetical protein
MIITGASLPIAEAATLSGPSIVNEVKSLSVPSSTAQHRMDGSIIRPVQSGPFVVCSSSVVCARYCVSNSQPISAKLGTEVQTIKCENVFVYGTHWISIPVLCHHLGFCRHWPVALQYKPNTHIQIANTKCRQAGKRYISCFFFNQSR